MAIVYGGLHEILTLMLSDDDHVQEQGMRCLVNLSAPAGFACGSLPGEVGRFGGLKAMQVDDVLDQQDNDESDETTDESSSEDEYDEVEGDEEGGCRDGHTHTHTRTHARTRTRAHPACLRGRLRARCDCMRAVHLTGREGPL